MAGLKRRYKIADSATIEDDGHTLCLIIQREGNGSMSMGIRRPHVGGLPELLSIRLSACGEFYYVDDFGLDARQWLSIETFPSKDEMLKRQPVGVLGPEGVEYTMNDGRVYWRRSMDFRWWEVKSKPEPDQWSKEDERVKDYLCIAYQKLRQSELEFNKELQPTGWTLAKLMTRIGEWVPIQEIPVVELKLDE